MARNGYKTTAPKRLDIGSLAWEARQHSLFAQTIRKPACLLATGKHGLESGFLLGLQACRYFQYWHACTAGKTLSLRNAMRAGVRAR